MYLPSRLQNTSLLNENGMTPQMVPRTQEYPPPFPPAAGRLPRSETLRSASAGRRAPPISLGVCDPAVTRVGGSLWGYFRSSAKCAPLFPFPLSPFLFCADDADDPVWLLPSPLLFALCRVRSPRLVPPRPPTWAASGGPLVPFSPPLTCPNPLEIAEFRPRPPLWET